MSTELNPDDVKQPASAAAAQSPAPPAKKTAAKPESGPLDESADADDESGDDGEYEDEDAASWLRRSTIYIATACASSMFVHMAVLILMGLWLLPVVDKSVKQEIVSSVEERPDEVVQQVLDDEIKPSKELALVSTAVSATMGAQGAVSALAEPQQMTQTAVSTVSTEVKVEVGEVNVFASNGKHLSQELPEGTLGEAAAIADSYAEAMDRITQEILNRLAKGKVLVVWLMDESQSMEDDRVEIGTRIDRVYQELGLSASARGDALQTAVCSYGKGFTVHLQQPTSDNEKIMAAIDGIQNDPSGDEMQCQAVSQALNRFRGYASQGGRQMIMVMVTDESGDPATNVQYLESTIAEAKAARCPIYVLGRESVFGYPYAYMVWRDPEKPQFGNYYLQIDRGPETPFPEQLQWEGFRRRNDAQASGFGPFEQARMARQTGGVFFLLPSPEVQLLNRDNRKYALESMRPYLPDLSSRADYAVERDKSEMRAVIWKIIADLNPWNKAVARQLEPRMTFSIEPPQFASQARESMEQAKRIIIYLQEAEKALEQVKPLRAKEASPRWRANFDMIYAQVLSYEVRMYEYGAYLEAFMQQPKPIKNVLGPSRPTNRWDFSGRDEMLTEAINSDRRDTAEATFRQIIVEHAGTPFESRAKWELGRKFGLALNESHQPPPYIPPPGVAAPKPPKF